MDYEARSTEQGEVIMSEPAITQALVAAHGMTQDEYQRLLGRISDVYTTGQTRATQTVNPHIRDYVSLNQFAA